MAVIDFTTAACLLASWLPRAGEHTHTWTAGCAEATSPVPSADSVSTTVGRSKTSNVPVVVSVAARPDSRCPVRALLDYIAFFPLLRLPQDGGCPLCLPRLRNNRPIIIIKPMTEADFIASPRVLVRVALLDRDERCYAGHPPAMRRRDGTGPGRRGRSAHPASRPLDVGRLQGVHRVRVQPGSESPRYSPTSRPLRRLVLSGPVPSFLPTSPPSSLLAPPRRRCLGWHPSCSFILIK